MKKIVVVLLAMIMVLSLCACDNSNKSDYVGTWVGKDYAGKDATITINADGTGTFVAKKGSRVTFTWELKGDTMVADFGDDATNATINRNATPYELTWGFLDPFVKAN